MLPRRRHPTAMADAVLSRPRAGFADPAARAGWARKPLRQPGDAAVLVVEADDVVLVDVVAARDFDHGERVGAAVLQPVLRLDRDERRLAIGQVEHAFARVTRAVPRTTTQCSLRR